MKLSHFFSILTEKLSFWNTLFRARFGSGIYSLMGAASFLLVFCSLFLGVFLKKWGLAWLLVCCGLILIILPMINLFFPTNSEGDLSAKNKSSEDSEPKNSYPGAAQDLQQKYDDDIKRDIAFEAALARHQIRRQEAERIRLKQKEEELRHKEELRNAQELWEAERKKRKAQLLREEELRQQQHNFNSDYFKNTSPIIKRTPPQPATSSEFFSGVSDTRELKKRYLALLKIYHPDNSTGDVETTRRIQSEYRNLLIFFKAYEKHRTTK